MTDEFRYVGKEEVGELVDMESSRERFPQPGFRGQTMLISTSLEAMCSK